MIHPPRLFRSPENAAAISLSALGLLLATWSTTGALAAEPASGEAVSAVEASLFGDVYAHPERWEPLEIGNLFSKGWDKPWVAPPTGEGGAPRQGWLMADDGVFYRLSLAIFDWQHRPGGPVDAYNGMLVNFTPINQRLNIFSNIPFVNASAAPGSMEREANFGDVQIQPRILLSESRAFSQTFGLNFRLPTGQGNNGRSHGVNGNGVAAVTPQYEFWSNAWKGLVVRGGAGFEMPYAGDIQQAGARSQYQGNLAIGYYMTPHSLEPFADTVGYVAANMTQYLDRRSPQSTTIVTVGPGFRTHMADRWYLLGTVEFPVTYPQPYDFELQASIMKVY
ncbi:MAG: hypothetical protein RIQ52_330 [Pseudomonadota bacterium]|jgi:hypothetical protein